MIRRAYDEFPTVNPGGGLIASGHPLGATGIRQIGKIYCQLTGNSVTDRRNIEVKNGLGMAVNIGGTGGSCCIHIMELEG